MPVYERVWSVIAREWGVDAGRVTEHASLEELVDGPALEVVGPYALWVGLQLEFGCGIDYDDAGDWRYVGDVVRFIEGVMRSIEEVGR